MTTSLQRRKRHGKEVAVTNLEARQVALEQLTPGDRIYVLRVTGDIPTPAEAVLTRSGIFEGTTTGTPQPRDRFRGATPRTVLAMIKWDGSPKAEQQSLHTIGLHSESTAVCTTSLEGLNVKEGRPLKQKEAFPIDL